ncbi:MAG: hypothetical protein AAB605_03280 [Patescibacteria group bacterium]
MKSFVKTIFMAFVLLPGLVFADSWIERVIHDAQEGNGTVIIENTSSVSTGGQTAASGQAVSTGDSSASSKVETHINANSETGGSVEVKVETSKDGVVETKEYSKDLAPDEPVNVNVSATVDSKGSAIETNLEAASAAQGDEEAASSTAEDAAIAEETSVKEDIKIVFGAAFDAALETIPNFFKKVFSFFWWF